MCQKSRYMDQDTKLPDDQICGLSPRGPLRVDVCRVCGGNNSTCQVVQGSMVASRHRPQVLKVQEGATSVLFWKEGVKSNSLALKDSRHNFIINGRAGNTSPGQFLVEGATWTYSNWTGMEIISANGPTAGAIAIVLLNNQRQRVKYRYWIPRSFPKVNRSENPSTKEKTTMPDLKTDEDIWKFLDSKIETKSFTKDPERTKNADRKDFGNPNLRQTFLEKTPSNAKGAYELYIPTYRKWLRKTSAPEKGSHIFSLSGNKQEPSKSLFPNQGSSNFPLPGEEQGMSKPLFPKHGVRTFPIPENKQGSTNFPISTDTPGSRNTHISTEQQGAFQPSSSKEEIRTSKPTLPTDRRGISKANGGVKPAGPIGSSAATAGSKFSQAIEDVLARYARRKETIKRLVERKKEDDRFAVGISSQDKRNYPFGHGQDHHKESKAKDDKFKLKRGRAAIKQRGLVDTNKGKSTNMNTKVNTSFNTNVDINKNSVDLGGKRKESSKTDSQSAVGGKKSNKTNKRRKRRRQKKRKRGKKKEYLPPYRQRPQDSPLINLKPSERCFPCPKAKDRARQFCTSDFVSKVFVDRRRTVGNETRYDITILSSYRNQVSLMRREYVWLESLCRCPRLKAKRTYIIMGHMKAWKERESRLVLTKASFVRGFSHGSDDKIRQLAKTVDCSEY